MSASDFVLALFVALAAVVAAVWAVLYRRFRRDPRVGAVVAGNFLLLVLLLSLGLVGGEVYYRFVHDDSDAYHVSLISSRWVERHYAFNNFGVRDDVDYQFRIGAHGSRRLTILGDSLTKGAGVPEVADRFGNRLRRLLPDWEVHVIAEDGFDTGQILDRLRSALQQGYELDVVLYAYCMNDVADLSPEWRGAVNRLYSAKPGFLVRHSYLLNTYYYRFRVRRDPVLARYFDHIARRYDDQYWDEQARRLAELEQLVEAHGGRLLVVTFPLLTELESQRFAAIHRRLTDYWQVRGVPQLDLRPAFLAAAGPLTVNRHDPHPNEAAHAIAATAIGAFLDEQLGVAVRRSAATAPRRLRPRSSRRKSRAGTPSARDAGVGRDEDAP